VGLEGPAPNDIDLMVVGSPAAEAIYQACDRVSDAVGRPVNPTILTREEIAAESGFLRDLAAKPTVPIIGEVPWPTPN